MPPSAPKPLRSLLTATVLVVAAHLALLQSLPAAFASMAGKDPSVQANAAVFSTRMISMPVAEPEPAQRAPQPSRSNTPSARSQPGSTAAASTDRPSTAGEMNPVAEPAIIAQDATDSIAPPVLIASNGTTRPDAPPKPTAKSVDTQELRQLFIPAPLRIKYEVKGEVKGFPYFANGELLWEHDGTNYAARLEISHFILGSRTQTSKGALTPQGLEPLRFGDKVRSEVAAHFERAKGKVSFSANAPDVPLQSGAQDQLSLFMQIAAMIAGEPARFTPGTQIPFQTIGPRSSEQWVFKVGEAESLKIAGVEMRTLKLTRDANGEYDPRGEVWLAPDLGYLPVRIRLIQPNGDFVEQNMRSAQKP